MRSDQAVIGQRQVGEGLGQHIDLALGDDADVSRAGQHEAVNGVAAGVNTGVLVESGQPGQRVRIGQGPAHIGQTATVEAGRRADDRQGINARGILHPEYGHRRAGTGEGFDLLDVLRCELGDVVDAGGLQRAVVREGDAGDAGTGRVELAQAAQRGQVKGLDQGGQSAEVERFQQGQSSDADRFQAGVNVAGGAGAEDQALEFLCLGDRAALGVEARQTSDVGNV